VTKHDEVRHILAQAGFKFKDGSPLEMTDAEVEEWLTGFAAAMSKLGRQLTIQFQALAVSFTQAAKSLRDINVLLSDTEEEK